MKIIKNYIYGQHLESKSGNFSEIFNPSTGEVIGKLISLIKIIRYSFGCIQKSHALDGKILLLLKDQELCFEFKNMLNGNIEEIAEIVSLEHGKTIEDAKGSITRGLEVVEFACGIPHLLKGEFSQNVGTEIDSWSVRQPLGICAGITPFNFPAMVPMWMFPISIACGNTFILKPSEKNPSCAIKLAELFSEAGLPDGVFNVVNGDKRIVEII